MHGLHVANVLFLFLGQEHIFQRRVDLRFLRRQNQQGQDFLQQILLHQERTVITYTQDFRTRQSSMPEYQGQFFLCQHQLGISLIIA